MNIYFEYKIKEEKLPKVKDLNKLFKDFIEEQLKTINIELRKASAAIDVKDKRALIAFNIDVEEPPKEIEGFYINFIDYVRSEIRLERVESKIRNFPDVDNLL